MKTRYKYIHFERVPHCLCGGFPLWDCRNNKTDNGLGVIGWCAQWREYVLTPDQNTIFSADCCRDIADFLGQLNEVKK